VTDVFTKKKRSDIMSRIRGKNTGIEKTVFSYLRRNNIYFQKHYNKVPGKPDIAIPSKKLAVFVNGDFWHGYKYQEWKERIPKNYWREKIENNIARDKKNYRNLRRAGWKVLRIWGHDITKKRDITLEKIHNFLTSPHN